VTGATSAWTVRHRGSPGNRLVRMQELLGSGSGKAPPSAHTIAEATAGVARRRERREPEEFPPRARAHKTPAVLLLPGSPAVPETPPFGFGPEFTHPTLIYPGTQVPGHFSVRLTAGVSQLCNRRIKSLDLRDYLSFISLSQTCPGTSGTLGMLLRKGTLLDPACNCRGQSSKPVPKRCTA
jgi:hypothetical protein